MTYCLKCEPGLFREDRLPVQRQPQPAEAFEERPTIRDRRQIDLEDAIRRTPRPEAPQPHR